MFTFLINQVSLQGRGCDFGSAWSCGTPCACKSFWSHGRCIVRHLVSFFHAGGSGIILVPCTVCHPRQWSGLYAFELGILNRSQELADARHRSAIGTVDAALTSVGTLVPYSSGLILHRPEEFHILVSCSAFFVCLGAVTYWMWMLLFRFIRHRHTLQGSKENHRHTLQQEEALEDGWHEHFHYQPPSFCTVQWCGRNRFLSVWSPCPVLGSIFFGNKNAWDGCNWGVHFTTRFRFGVGSDGPHGGKNHNFTDNFSEHDSRLSCFAAVDIVSSLRNLFSNCLALNALMSILFASKRRQTNVKERLKAMRSKYIHPLQIQPGHTFDKIQLRWQPYHWCGFSDKDLVFPKMILWIYVCCLSFWSTCNSCQEWLVGEWSQENHQNFVPCILSVFVAGARIQILNWIWFTLAWSRDQNGLLKKT